LQGRGHSRSEIRLKLMRRALPVLTLEKHTQNGHELTVPPEDRPVWRRGIRALCALLLCVFVASAAHNGSEAEYLGGTRPDIPANKTGEIRVTDDVYFVFVSKHTQVSVPYERINLLEYGQKVDRRYVAAAVISPLFMLAKKREHFLTIGFQDDDGRQQAMMFRVDKNGVRLTLVALEARTGQKVEYQDEEARLAGKG
jgi:hypothetical protein